ncbi:MAG: hypothetical protein KA191_14860 [Verrucomicrobia bacterium]|jgi:hypothetical protein|nr:hypothetical protein [Verrucomicrobiota bacterium]OQC65716.1 MAG: hypothetical protein BWX48_02229 [Verrucomicrobia bacterium ADurb.Bin006]MDI9381185.1 hypothetical protein [Verrucomicrobiota bacterium]HOA61734.1 hypothetical protein [Verrucomicrobiota bacterium]HOF49286.1 hypothetical protein [Verrucomicrobiota bacterium]
MLYETRPHRIQVHVRGHGLYYPWLAGLPAARALVAIERTTTFGQNEEPTIAFYTTSLMPAPGCARRFAELARGHWGGSESRNQWVPDACFPDTRQAPLQMKRS